MENAARICGDFGRSPSGDLFVQMVIGHGSTARQVQIDLDENFGASALRYERQKLEPIQLKEIAETLWAYRNKVVICDDGVEVELGRDKLMLLIKQAVLRDENRWVRIQREVKAFENLDRLPSARREKIPDNVRLFVWQRDEGRCVRCGSPERLEFDHIIPIAEGGGNTERNIQLLCESCNRRKGKSI